VSGTVHEARLVAARTLATDVVEYQLALPDEDAALRWRPGQFISVRVGTQPDGTAILRSYSLGSRAGADGRFKLLLKLVAGGPASEWFRALPVGGAMRFTGPMGFFVLDLAHAGDVVLGATGTGLAPIVPMIEELLERDEPGRIHLFFGVRAETDLFWERELARLADLARGRLALTIALSRPSPSWSGARGRINPLLFALLPSLARPTFYLCGNGAMIREVKAGLMERGVDRKRQIRTEAFFD
jgi:ferredoxin-NADP reductase